MIYSGTPSCYQARQVGIGASKVYLGLFLRKPILVPIRFRAEHRHNVPFLRLFTKRTGSTKADIIHLYSTRRWGRSTEAVPVAPCMVRLFCSTARAEQRRNNFYSPRKPVLAGRQSNRKFASRWSWHPYPCRSTGIQTGHRQCVNIHLDYSPFNMFWSSEA